MCMCIRAELGGGSDDDDDDDDDVTLSQFLLPLSLSLSTLTSSELTRARAFAPARLLHSPSKSLPRRRLARSIDRSTLDYLSFPASPVVISQARAAISCAMKNIN